MAISTCRACGAVFQSTYSFDQHRVGKFEQADESGKVRRKNTRRCLSEAQMRAKGMMQTERGRWITGANPLFGESDARIA